MEANNSLFHPLKDKEEESLRKWTDLHRDKIGTQTLNFKTPNSLPRALGHHEMHLFCHFLVRRAQEPLLEIKSGTSREDISITAAMGSKKQCLLQRMKFSHLVTTNLSGRRLLRVPWTERRSNQSILKEISPGCSLEELMLKLKL